MDDFEKNINASDLIDWIMCAFPDWCEGDVQKIVDHIDEMPSVHQVLIRCKDCKYWDTAWSGNWAGGGYYCPNVDGVRDGDFFCADAERKDDEQIRGSGL